MSNHDPQSPPARGGPMTGARLLVESLAAHGVTDIFAVPGLQLDPLFAALHDARDRIRTMHTRHEQATSYMADGYARSTGRLGVCAVVPGPGLLNAMSGLATAYGAYSPVLCVSGQVPSAMVNSGLGVLHEIDDQLEMLRPITRHAARIMDVDTISTALRDAVAQARHIGVPGPVEIEVPSDILSQRTGAAVVAPSPAAPAEPDGAAIDAAAELIAACRAPVIIAGGGVLASGAWSALEALAQRLGAPVLMTPNGKGALPDPHPLAFTLGSAKALLRKADLVLAVGTRLGQWLLGQALDPQTTMIRIDLDPDQLDKRVRPAVGISADADLALTALAKAFRDRPLPPSAWSGLSEMKARTAAEINALQPQADFGLAIRGAIPADAIVVNESTQVGVWCSVGFPVHTPRSFLTSGHMGTLGSGFPIALGAKVGNPDRVVVSINGDGGFMFNVQELSTMVDHHIGVIAVVFNDNAYGNVKRIQVEQYGGRVLSSDLHNPDFVRLAEAFGVSASRARTPDQLRDAIRAAAADGGPALIEVPVGPMPSPGPLLGWPLPPSTD